MSAPPQRLSDTSRPIANASTFFVRELLAPKDGRSPRAPSGRIGHAVACGGLSSGDQSGGNGLDMRSRATKKTCAILGCGSVSGAANTFSNNSFEVAA